MFDGIAAPVFYAGQNQMNVQVPYEVATRESTTMVATFGGQARGVFTIPVKASHPGICAVTNADGSLPGPQSPAAVGGTVVIWGTGAGIPGKPAKTGMPSPPNATVQAMVTVGGISATPLYAGLTPGGVGLMQVNVTIPAGSPSGDEHSAEGPDWQYRIADGIHFDPVMSRAGPESEVDTFPTTVKNRTEFPRQRACYNREIE